MTLLLCKQKISCLKLTHSFQRMNSKISARTFICTDGYFRHSNCMSMPLLNSLFYWCKCFLVWWVIYRVALSVHIQFQCRFHWQFSLSLFGILSSVFKGQPMLYLDLFRLRFCSTTRPWNYTLIKIVFYFMIYKFDI